MRNLEEYNLRHPGCTCFIIGSGPSLHFQDLQPLSEYVTIAVNAGYLAFTQSDYFVTDDWSVAHWSYFFDDLKNSRITTPLLYEDKLKKEAARFEDRSVLFRHRKGHHLTSKYVHDDKSHHILESRTSLGSAMHIAHIMGCKKIILLGVDCCRVQGRRWFWQFRTDPPFRNDNVLVDSYKRAMHKGRQSDSDLISILKAWNVLAKEFSKGCSVINASAYSIVTDFPKMTLEECLDSNTKL